jgi:hypothetical protein
MVTTILITISCIVFSFIVGLYCGFCRAAKIYERDISKLWTVVVKISSTNDIQYDQIDRLILIAKNQNEVLNKFVNILDNLKLKVETEYPTKKQLKNSNRARRSSKKTK